ncbi:hypothetical protein BDZ89DRAFT_1231103 [Hymenopellis radicata]|nr:hypothetical protein BDZ89DRAFT_1231103 [Hymenopellis radicata]
MAWGHGAGSLAWFYQTWVADLGRLAWFQRTQVEPRYSGPCGNPTRVEIRQGPACGNPTRGEMRQGPLLGSMRKSYARRDSTGSNLRKSYARRISAHGVQLEHCSRELPWSMRESYARRDSTGSSLRKSYARRDSTGSITRVHAEILRAERFDRVHYSGPCGNPTRVEIRQGPACGNPTRGEIRQGPTCGNPTRGGFLQMVCLDPRAWVQAKNIRTTFGYCAENLLFFALTESLSSYTILSRVLLSTENTREKRTSSRELATRSLALAFAHPRGASTDRKHREQQSLCHYSQEPGRLFVTKVCRTSTLPKRGILKFMQASSHGHTAVDLLWVSHI